MKLEVQGEFLISRAATGLIARNEAGKGGQPNRVFFRIFDDFWQGFHMKNLEMSVR
ncbi:hypothetical protein [Prosthecobacter algae]|uniref:hypothetical protein n=1 Tax=Prosthecobacter algae TaxID=1144682 RepID=UPI0031ED2B74